MADRNAGRGNPDSTRGGERQPPNAAARVLKFHGERRKAAAEELRALIVAEDITVAEAARKLGIPRKVANNMALEHSIRASDRAVAAAAKLAGAQANAARSATAAAIDAEIFALWRSHSRTEIAAKLGLKIGRVRKAIERGLKGGLLTTKKMGANHPAVIAMRRQRDADAARLREVVEQGNTVTAAAAICGFSRSRARSMAAEYRITVAPDVLLAAWRRNAAAGHAKRSADAEARRKRELMERWTAPVARERNPKLSAGQQATVDRLRCRSWRKEHPLGIPSNEEADALVREWLAKNKPTVGPAPRIEEPSNFGAKWR